jgi:hypothetical protein
MDQDEKDGQDEMMNPTEARGGNPTARDRGPIVELTHLSHSAIRDQTRSRVTKAIDRFKRPVWIPRRAGSCRAVIQARLVFVG